MHDREKAATKPVLLVVDDDVLILELLNDILQDRFTVVTATNGLLALEKLRTLSTLDGIVTDLNMPHMHGTELMRKVRQHYPNLPIIGLSGTEYPNQRITPDCPEGVVLLQKPFEVKNLLNLAKQFFLAKPQTGIEQQNEIK